MTNEVSGWSERLWSICLQTFSRAETGEVVVTSLGGGAAEEGSVQKPSAGLHLDGNWGWEGGGEGTHEFLEMALNYPGEDAGWQGRGLWDRATSWGRWDDAPSMVLLSGTPPLLLGTSGFP